MNTKSRYFLHHDHIDHIFSLSSKEKNYYLLSKRDSRGEKNDKKKKLRKEQTLMKKKKAPGNFTSYNTIWYTESGRSK